jgi:maleylacetoacetate isomerase
MMTLYGYWRSSASYRVRIGLALKGIAVSHVPVNLRDGSQKQADHLARNPQGYVPVLELADGTQLTQSLAILDYLDGVYREPALLPKEAVLRARVKAAALMIAADISPIQNLSVLKFIRAEHGQEDAGVTQWAAHWIVQGFEALEALAETSDTDYLLTDTPSLFECCLVPQVYNARRFGVDMATFSRLSEIDARCRALPAFQKAAPENQADAIKA